jgi:hypothetical protein
LTIGQMLQHTSHCLLAALPRSVKAASNAATVSTAVAGDPASSTSDTPAYNLRQRKKGTDSTKGDANTAAQQPDATEPSAQQTTAPSEYSLPRGGLFELVSCPHYLGEVIIYAGLAVVVNGDRLALAVLAWVVRPSAG